MGGQHVGVGREHTAVAGLRGQPIRSVRHRDVGACVGELTAQVVPGKTGAWVMLLRTAAKVEGVSDYVGRVLRSRCRRVGEGDGGDGNEIMNGEVSETTRVDCQDKNSHASASRSLQWLNPLRNSPW